MIFKDCIIVAHKFHPCQLFSQKIVRNFRSHAVPVSLIFQPKLNAETPVLALFQHMSQHCFSICHSGVSTYVIALFQHMSQRCFIICYNTVSAYVSALFQHMSQRCFSICYNTISAYVSALFQHMSQQCFGI